MLSIILVSIIEKLNDPYDIATRNNVAVLHKRHVNSSFLSLLGAFQSIIKKKQKKKQKNKQTNKQTNKHLHKIQIPINDAFVQHRTQTTF
jgi:hypothetical protein